MMRAVMRVGEVAAPPLTCDDAGDVGDVGISNLMQARAHTQAHTRTCAQGEISPASANHPHHSTEAGGGRSVPRATCKGCLRDLVHKRDWYALDSATRAQRRSEGYIAHYKDGLCARCFKRRKRDPTKRDQMSRDLMLAEYDFYRLFGRSQAENCRRTANALGISWRTVERAVLRAKKDGQL